MSRRCTTELGLELGLELRIGLGLEWYLGCSVNTVEGNSGINFLLL